MVGNLIATWEEATTLLNEARGSGECAIDTETNGLRWALGNSAVLATFAATPEGGYLCRDASLVSRILAELHSCGVSFVFHNAVFDLHMLRVWTGWEPEGGYSALKLEDTMHGFRVQFPGTSAKLKVAAQRFVKDLDVTGPQQAVQAWISAHSRYETVAGKRTLVQPNFSEVPLEILAPYAILDAMLTLRCHRALKQLRDAWERPPYLAAVVPTVAEAYQLEIDLVKWVIVDLEKRGMPVRMAALRSGLTASSEKVSDLQRQWSDLGYSASITSSIQLRKLFYDGFNEPVKHRSKPTKTFPLGGPSTSEAALSDAETPQGKRAASVLLPFRAWKNYSNRLSEINSFIASDGRVHTSLKADVARTGRLSSSDPALQNLSRPDPLKEYTMARGVFGPPQGYEWLIWDLSQIELRLAAHFMQDQEMIRAFHTGVDFHSLTAARMYGVTLDQVTKNMRSIAKILNFSILYGAGVRKITATLRYGVAGTAPLDSADVSNALKLLLPEEYKFERGAHLHRRETATGIYAWEELTPDLLYKLLGETLYSAYHKENPKVSEFTSKASDKAKRHGGVYTAFGLFIPIPQPTWSAEHKRFLTYFHKGGNAVVQGSAAGLMKALMVRDVQLLQAYATQNDLKLWEDVSLIMSIHDEAIHEVPVGHAQRLAQFINGPLSDWPQFNVPIVLEYAFVPEGGNWAEKAKLEVEAKCA